MKVKGLWYPEVQGRTKSTFVVNKSVFPYEECSDTTI